jgi:hypothetical protein
MNFKDNIKLQKSILTYIAFNMKKLKYDMSNIPIKYKF